MACLNTLLKRCFLCCNSEDARAFKGLNIGYNPSLLFVFSTLPMKPLIDELQKTIQELFLKNRWSITPKATQRIHLVNMP